MPIALPEFGTLLSALNRAGVVTRAGVETRSAHGFWGGVTKNNKIVVTAWIDAKVGNGRFRIARPRTGHGRLKDMWEEGRIQPGATVKLILVRQRGDAPLDKGQREVASAGLMPGDWRVVKMVGERHAIVEPV
jgi:hypothetical protein